MYGPKPAYFYGPDQLLNHCGFAKKNTAQILRLSNAILNKKNTLITLRT